MKKILLLISIIYFQYGLHAQTQKSSPTTTIKICELDNIPIPVRQKPMEDAMLLK